MNFIVMVVGIGLMIFGALVLLKFPYRPGGKITWGGIEISSMGAGLPLIVLGVICIVISSTGISPEDLCKIYPDICNGKSENCFEGIPEDRVATMEEGAKYIQLIGPHQSKDEAIAINFTENRKPIGAIKFYYMFDNKFFKVDSIVDSECKPIEDYENVNRGGDKHVLQSWDTLQIQFGDHTYELSLDYHDGTINAEFKRVSP